MVFDFYVRDDERTLVFEKLPQYCYRRMLVFDRMRDVLYNNFNIDNDWFGLKCEKFKMDMEDLIVTKTLCHNIYSQISTRPLLKDLEQKIYYRNIKLLNSKFSS
jgi:hypothetical protein